VPAGTAANKAVVVKREKYGVNRILTTGFHVAALERFGYFHPDTTRLARALGAIHASRQAPLMEDHFVADALDQNGLEARGATSATASRILTRMSIALRRSDAIILLARRQRKRTGPLQVPLHVEETRFGVLACWRGRGRGHTGEADVAAAFSAAKRGTWRR